MKWKRNVIFSVAMKVELMSSEGIFRVLADHPKVPGVWYVLE
jgi:hypothetical protein